MKCILTLLLTCLLALLPACSAIAEAPCSSARPTPDGYTAQPAYALPAPDSSFENALLIGDSIAGSIADYNSFPALEVEYYIGLSPIHAHYSRLIKVKGQYMSLFEIAVAAQPDKLLVLLGSNGLAHKDAAEILPDYHALLDDLLQSLPGTEIYLLSVTPTSKKALAESPRLTLDNIRAFNDALLAMAQEHGVYYIDVFTPLLNGDGAAIRTDLVAGDGVHLTRSGIDILVETLRLHVHP